MIYSITCSSQTSGPRLRPADDKTSTQRWACKELAKCPQTRSLQNLGTVLSILQHHLLVPYLASNHLFACVPRVSCHLLIPPRKPWTPPGPGSLCHLQQPFPHGGYTPMILLELTKHFPMPKTRRR